MLHSIKENGYIGIGNIVITSKGLRQICIGTKGIIQEWDEECCEGKW